MIIDGLVFKMRFETVMGKFFKFTHPAWEKETWKEMGDYSQRSDVVFTQEINLDLEEFNQQQVAEDFEQEWDEQQGPVED